MMYIEILKHGTKIQIFPAILTKTMMRGLLAESSCDWVYRRLGCMRLSSTFLPFALPPSSASPSSPSLLLAGLQCGHKLLRSCGRGCVEGREGDGGGGATAVAQWRRDGVEVVGSNGGHSSSLANSVMELSLGKICTGHTSPERQI